MDYSSLDRWTSFIELRLLPQMSAYIIILVIMRIKIGSFLNSFRQDSGPPKITHVFLVELIINVMLLALTECMHVEHGMYNCSCFVYILKMMVFISHFYFQIFCDGEGRREFVIKKLLVPYKSIIKI